MGGILEGLFPVRPRVFVGYHHAGDQVYYDSFSKHFHDTHEVVFDNSLERRVDSDNPDYVRRRIREHHISGTSCTVVLVGRDTWGRKYVDWEIDATLEMQHGLIGVQLPTLPVSFGNKVSVPGRLHDNIVSGFALWIHWQQVAGDASQLGNHVATAKLRSSKLIVNSRERRLRNA